MAVVVDHHQINLNSSNHNPLQPPNDLIRPMMTCPPTSSSCLPSGLVDLRSTSTASIQKSIQAFSLNSNNQTNSKGKLWQQALLNPIKFIKSPAIFTQSQFPYAPINKPNQLPTHPKLNQESPNTLPPSSTSSTSAHTPYPPSIKAQSSSQPVATYWTRPQSVGPGFYNTGNTCFLNATLQVLVHTPALVIGLMDREEHTPTSCRLARNKKFCALCRMHRLVSMCFDKTCGTHAIEPTPINRALSKFAPTMRGNRQEDAHEFLRLLIEAMQNGALEGQAEKAKQKQKESTFIHQMFGGKLRSRVVCEHCNAASDTFDNFLDLSLDISQANSVTSALKAYHKFDRLKGANQYKCEKCKCLRDARKTMSVFSAPPILTLHLKRFNFRGQKINKRVNFEDSLDLRPAMSEGSGPTGYKLYGVVCHRGQSNKRGHYYSYVKASNGKWYSADDSTVEPISDSRMVMANEHAYMLFYARDRECLLSDAIGGNRPSTSTSDLDSPECGKFVKRKPSISDDVSFPTSHSNRTDEMSSDPQDQDVTKNKRAKMSVMTPSEQSANKSSEIMHSDGLLPTFKTHGKAPHPAHHDESNDQSVPTTADGPSKQDHDSSALFLACSGQSENLIPGCPPDNPDVVAQTPPSTHLFNKKNRNRRQKLKNRRLVNMSGCQISNLKPRIM